MLVYLSLYIVCSSKLKVSFQTVRFSEQLTSEDKYRSMFIYLVSKSCKNEGTLSLFFLGLFGFSFRVDEKHFENGAFRKWRHDIHVFSWTEFSSKTNSKSLVTVALLRFSGVVWTEKMWCVFREKPSLRVAVPSPSPSRFSSGGEYGYT